ncbi:MAG: Gfo/Idh/MocA family oxidoreductase [Armatimonadetes bacterium]|nr:Gfo/Idh/MocA family oxidoreductase [Armatimonadota bacterium]
MRSFRVALVGLSPVAARRPDNTFFGRAINSHAAAYAVHPNCEVVAVCDIRRDMVTAFRSTWADTWPTIAGYNDFRDLLSDGVPDIVSVCTPDNAHAHIVEDAASAGVAGILCEKPLATDLADADRMIAACEAHGTALVVHHNRRFLPVYHRVRDLLLAGEIGRLQRLSCYHAEPRAMLFRNGTQMVDTLCFLAGSPVVDVWGRLEPGYEHWDRYRGDGGHDAHSEPSAAARLTFANGVTAAYEGVRTRGRVVWFDVGGTEGSVRVQDRYAELTTQAGSSVLVPEPYDGGGVTAAVSEVVRLLLYGGESISSPRAARHTLEILLAILESHRRGNQPVRL